MKPKISIIIPVYHVEEYITMCLLSVANQTMTDGIECILVDDCGDDESIVLTKSFIANYNGNVNFQIIHRERNGGLSAARNSGIDAAQGEYLYFLDSDDEITPNCMELMWEMVNKYGKVDLVQGSFFETEDEKKTLSQFDFPEFSVDRKMIKSFLLKYEGDIVGAQSRLIKRSILIEHNLLFKEGIIHEDNYWTFFISKYISSMAFCKERTYYHRYNPNSITGNVNTNKEIIAYKIIIGDCSQNIDSFLPGYQKEWILNNLITALRGEFYVNKESLIRTFALCNNFLEKRILKFYLVSQNSKILHILIRLYKLFD